MTNTGTNSVATYRVGPSRHDHLARGRRHRSGRHLLGRPRSGDLLAASNAGSGSVTTLRTAAGGGVTKIADAKTAGGGTVDATFSRDGDVLYVQTGATGAVDTFGVNGDGTLNRTSTVTVPDAVGGEAHPSEWM